MALAPAPRRRAPAAPCRAPPWWRARARAECRRPARARARTGARGSPASSSISISQMGARSGGPPSARAHARRGRCTACAIVLSANASGTVVREMSVAKRGDEPGALGLAEHAAERRRRRSAAGRAARPRTGHSYSRARAHAAAGAGGERALDRLQPSGARRAAAAARRRPRASVAVAACRNRWWRAAPCARGPRLTAAAPDGARARRHGVRRDRELELGLDGVRRAGTGARAVGDDLARALQALAPAPTCMLTLRRQLGAAAAPPRRARAARRRWRPSRCSASVIDTPYSSGCARHQVLPAGVDVAFDHHAEDARVAAGDLRRDVARDVDLALVLLLAVGVRAVDHHARARGPLFGELLARRRPRSRRRSWCALPPRRMMWQSSLPAGVHDGGVAALGHRQEVMRRRRRLDRVDGDPDVAVGAVLEADRARQARRELAMHLALGGARADGAPGDQVRDVLRRDHVEVLGAGRQVELVDLEQDAPREAQAFVDAEAVVEARIVDEALPADGGARLLEIHAHHDDEAVGELAPSAPRAASRSRSPRRSRGSSRGRRPPAGGRRRRAARDGSRGAPRRWPRPRARSPETRAAGARAATAP